MIVVHVRDDVGFRRGQRAASRGEHADRRLDPVDAAEPGDEMAALDRDPVEVEIGKAGIERALEGWRAQKRAEQRRVVGALGPPEHASARGPVSGSAWPAGAVEQQRDPRIGRDVLRVLGEVGQQQQRAARRGRSATSTSEA